MPLDVYVFRGGAFARDGDTVVCIGERRHIDNLISIDLMNRSFFGHALYRGFTGTEYLGVWGARNASKFRRFLREQGAEITIHRKEPIDVRLSHFTTFPGARG